MRYSIVKIVLFLFSSSFFAINQNPPEVQKAIKAINQAISKNTVLSVNGPDEMPGINDIENGDVVSFTNNLYNPKYTTSYINKYLPKNSSLLWSKMRSFSINGECSNLYKILTKKSSNNTANKNLNWKIWLYEGNDNVYYYFEIIKQNTEKKSCKKTSTAKKPPRKRQKISAIEEKSLSNSAFAPTEQASDTQNDSKPISIYTQVNNDDNYVETNYAPSIYIENYSEKINTNIFSEQDFLYFSPLQTTFAPAYSSNNTQNYSEQIINYLPNYVATNYAENVPQFMPTYPQENIIQIQNYNLFNIQQYFSCSNNNCSQAVAENLNPIKKEANEIINHVDSNLFENLDYIDFFNYKNNVLYLSKRCCFCKIDKSDIVIEHQTYKYEMYKFVLAQEKSAWYIKKTFYLTGDFQEYIYIKK